jgi:organic radical activating enzyme
MDQTDKYQIESFAVLLTEHCNLACDACDHLAPYYKKGPTTTADIDVIRRDLTALGEVLHTKNVRVSGGEPLLHPQLVKILKLIRSTGITDTIKLISNGLLLHRAPPEMWSLIDHFSTTVYPVKYQYKVEEIQEICRANNVTCEIQPREEMRITQIVSKNEDADLVQSIYDHCPMKRILTGVHKGKFYICPPSVHLELHRKLLGLSSEPADLDGVPIHDNPNLREEIAQAMESRTPLKSCSYCVTVFGRKFDIVPTVRQKADQYSEREYKTALECIAPRHLPMLTESR